MYEMNAALNAFSFEHVPHIMVVTPVSPRGATCWYKHKHVLSALELQQYKYQMESLGGSTDRLTHTYSTSALASPSGYQVVSTTAHSTAYGIPATKKKTDTASDLQTV